MRILGLDYGDNRIGVAMTDPLCLISNGLETITSKGSEKTAFKRLDEIIEQYNVGVIVVGMPINMNGTMGERVEKTKLFIHKLKCRYNKIKIDTMDERLTTVQANRTMYELNIDRDKKKNLVDTISAAYILEMYMNKIKKSSEL